ncbi:MAG: hypothetical protein MJZ93_03150 [Paludibacteraceae bacterium]|nr:hypothetical protein [Paludibacteraceae bacterium]
MKKVLKLFVALMAVTILSGCSDINSPNSIGDAISNPEKLVKAKVLFSNQSNDPYAIIVNCENGVDQFNMEGNSNITRTYPIGTYKIHIEQKEGYVIYPSKYDVELELGVEGAKLYWDNKKIQKD